MWNTAIKRKISYICVREWILTVLASLTVTFLSMYLIDKVITYNHINLQQTNKAIIT